MITSYTQTPISSNTWSATRLSMLILGTAAISPRQIPPVPNGYYTLYPLYKPNNRVVPLYIIKGRFLHGLSGEG